MTNGRTALHIAAELGNNNSMETLLNHNPDINITDDASQTPLHRAVLFNKLETIDLLLKHKPLIISDIEGNTPLRYCFDVFHDNSLRTYGKAMCDLYPVREHSEKV